MPWYAIIAESFHVSGCCTSWPKHSVPPPNKHSLLNESLNLGHLGMHIFSLVKPAEHFDQLNHAGRCVLLARRHYFPFVLRGKPSSRFAVITRRLSLPSTDNLSKFEGRSLAKLLRNKKKREEVQTDKYDLCARWGTSWKFSHPLYRILINHILHQWGWGCVRVCVCEGGDYDCPFVFGGPPLIGRRSLPASEPRTSWKRPWRLLQVICLR